jgi:hypothetical protein
MNFSAVENKKILLSCLNWGMGHTARCIGLIEELLNKNNAITFAGNSQQISIINTYFPHLPCINLDGYPFDFKENESFSKSIWRNKWKLFEFLKTEQKFVNNLLKLQQFDLVLSDHRYGFRSSNCTSVFLTHQYHLPLRGIETLFKLVHRHWISKFDAIWILDQLPENLAGKLSRIKPNLKRAEYIGWHSRFKKMGNEKSELNERELTSILLLSGPDIHHKILLDYFSKSYDIKNKPIIIGSEKAIQKLRNANSQFEMIVSKDWKGVDRYLFQSKEVFSFFGYSTLMDSRFLETQFHLIPCPTQEEQIYLSKIHVNGVKQRSLIF